MFLKRPWPFKGHVVSSEVITLKACKYIFQRGKLFKIQSSCIGAVYEDLCWGWFWYPWKVIRGHFFSSVFSYVYCGKYLSSHAGKDWWCSYIVMKELFSKLNLSVIYIVYIHYMHTYIKVVAWVLQIFGSQ